MADPPGLEAVPGIGTVLDQDGGDGADGQAAITSTARRGLRSKAGPGTDRARSSACRTRNLHQNCSRPKHFPYRADGRSNQTFRI